MGYSTNFTFLFFFPPPNIFQKHVKGIAEFILSNLAKIDETKKDEETSRNEDLDDSEVRSETRS